MANTPTVDLEKPTVGGSASTWGGSWNDNADKIDAFITANVARVLDSGVFSATAFVDIELSDDFDAWTLHLINVVPSASSALIQLQFSFDGGATFKSGASDYTNVYESVVNTGTTINSSDATSNSIGIAGNVSNGAGKSTSSRAEIASVTGVYTSVEASSIAYGSAAARNVTGGFCIVETDKATHVRVSPDTGTLASGKWALLSKPGL